MSACNNKFYISNWIHRNILKVLISLNTTVTDSYTQDVEQKKEFKSKMKNNLHTKPEWGE